MLATTHPKAGPEIDGPAPGCSSAKSDSIGLRVIFRRFWPATMAYRGRLSLSILLALVVPGLTAAQIWLFKLVIDDVLVPHDISAFWPLAVAYLAMSAGIGLASFADDWLADWLGERFALDLRTRLFDHLQRLSVDFFDRSALGDTLSRLTGDIDAIEALVLSGVTRVLTYACEIVFFTAALFYLNWKLALVSLAAAPGFLLIARSFSTRIRRASRQQRRRAGSLTATAEESLSNVALVQAYDRRARQTELFHHENTLRFRAEMIASRLRAMFGPLVEMLESLGVLLVIGIGAWELSRGRITLGGVMVFSTYLMQLYSPLRGAGKFSNTAYTAAASAERIIEVLDRRPEVVETTVPRALGRARGALRFHGVGFGYPGSRTRAVNGVGFTVEPGQRVALVGASGSGKSTVGKLLLRFYDPDTGVITLDDVDLRELNLSYLRANVAAVLQETLVFDATIAENILWGRADASHEQMVAAAIAADAHDFITALPEGYDTRIGQRGRLLSGGQRQRLAIARAMIRDAPLLLLDEPTTGLDAESTARVGEAMRRLMAGRATVIISHNLLTVADADRIVFLSDGQVSASGTHDELLESSPGYARLYRLHQNPANQPVVQPRRSTTPDPRPSPRRRTGTHFDPAPPPRVEVSPGGRRSSKGKPPLVLENLPGATLGYLLETETRLGSADIGHLGRHICSALRYLHGLGYLHLDVKPSRRRRRNGPGSPWRRL